MLYISKITTINALGLEEYSLEPGKKITLVKGRNASGKSSLATAIRSALGGPGVVADATLIRTSAEKANVLIVFSDDRTPDEPHGELDADIRPGKINRKVRVPKFGVIGASAAWLNDLLDLRLANPLEFLAVTDPKERARWLLESMPLKLSAEDLVADSGLSPTDVATLMKQHPLEALRKADGFLTEFRKQQNVKAKEYRATMKTLAETAPKLTVVGVSQAEVENRRQTLTEIRQKATEAMDEARREAITALRSAEEVKIASCAEAERVYREALLAASNIFNEASQNIGHAKELALGQIATDFQKPIDEARVSLEAAERSLADWGAVEQSRQAQEKFKQQAETAEAISAQYSARLEAIAARRSELLKQNPLPETEVIDGEIFVKGVPFQRLNEAERIDLSVRLAEQRAGKLGFICVDGIQALDPEHQERLVARLLESGMQCIMTEVALGPLRTREIGSVEDLRASQNESAQMVLDRTKP